MTFFFLLLLLLFHYLFRSLLKSSLKFFDFRIFNNQHRINDNNNSSDFFEHFVELKENQNCVSFLSEMYNSSLIEIEALATQYSLLYMGSYLDKVSKLIIEKKELFFF